MSARLSDALAQRPDARDISVYKRDGWWTVGCSDCWAFGASRTWAGAMAAANRHAAAEHSLVGIFHASKRVAS